MRLDSRISRRDALWALALVSAGVAVSACTPLRVVAGLYPEEFKREGERVERVLRAFLLTVIPGAPADAPDLTRAFFDRKYPFARYVAFFASDLCRRASEQCGDDRFWALDEPERIRVITDGLSADATTRKLYSGAIFLAHLSFYSGIYNDDAGCALIDFPGRYRGDAVSYAGASRFLPPGRTATGNYS